MKLIQLVLLCVVWWSSAAIAQSGTVTFDVRSIVLQNDQLTEVPYVEANIYLDGNHPYGSGIIAARTDQNGRAELELEVGEHTVIFSKWTSSHSVFASPVYRFVVEDGQVTAFSKALVTSRATIVANYDAGWGNALYVTGQSDLLGNWKTAYRLNYAGNAQWANTLFLPLGLEYKIVRAPWIDGVTEISTKSVQWQYGANNEIQFVEYLSNLVYPQF